MAGKKYQQPRRVPEETVFTDKRTKRKKADEYTGQVHSVFDPDTYTGRDVAKEKMLRQFKGKIYYGQTKV